MNDRVSPAIALPTQFGTPIGAAFYAGRLIVAGAACGLLFAPRATGRRDSATLMKKNWRAKDAVALSYSDGLANTRALAAAGSEVAQWALDLNLDGRQWHIPSRLEALVLFGERDDAGDAAARFRPGGDEAFEEAWYWTSTQHADDSSCAWIQSFLGDQYGGHKDLECHVCAVSRVLLP